MSDLTLEIVKQFINDNEDAKKWLQSEKDSVVTKGITTYKTNFMEKDFPKLLEDEIKKRYPDEDPQVKRLKELELKFEQAESEKKRAILQSKLTQRASEKKLPTFLVDYSLADDEESSYTKLEQLSSKYLEHVNNEVAERLKGNSRRSNSAGGGDDVDDVDLSKIPDNDPDYFIKNKDAINKLMTKQ